MAFCRLCGSEIFDLDFEKHLWEYHCITYRDYYEVIMHMPEPEECWRCGTVKYPLAYIHSDFPGIPCWGCIKKKTHLEATRKQIIETLVDMQEEFIKNKYYRHRICFPEDLSASITHNLPETAGILDTISKKGFLKPGKRGEEVFYLKRENLACPYEISKENIDSMVMEILPVSCEQECDDTFEIIIGTRIYHVSLPVKVEYNNKVYPKYNILTKTKKTDEKQLRIGKTDKVYVFYDVLEKCDKIKSIFKVHERVKQEDIPALCDILLSNGAFRSIIQEIYSEIINSSGMVGIFDRVFFKNYIRLDQPDASGLEVEFSWNKKETNNNNLTILIWS